MNLLATKSEEPIIVEAFSERFASLRNQVYILQKEIREWKHCKNCKFMNMAEPSVRFKECVLKTEQRDPESIACTDWEIKSS